LDCVIFGGRYSCRGFMVRVFSSLAATRISRRVLFVRCLALATIVARASTVVFQICQLERIKNRKGVVPPGF